MGPTLQHQFCQHASILWLIFWTVHFKYLFTLLDGVAVLTLPACFHFEDWKPWSTRSHGLENFCTLNILHSCTCPKNVIWQICTNLQPSSLLFSHLQKVRNRRAETMIGFCGKENIFLWKGEFLWQWELFCDNENAYHIPYHWFWSKSKKIWCIYVIIVFEHKHKDMMHTYYCLFFYQKNPNWLPCLRLKWLLRSLVKQILKRFLRSLVKQRQKKRAASHRRSNDRFEILKHQELATAFKF